MVAEKKWIIFAVMVLLVIGGFYAGNKFYFYPHFTVHLQPLPRYIPPKEIGPENPIKPFDVTIKKMREPIGKEKPINKTSVKTGTERNPFLWQGELTPKEPVTRKKREKPVTIPRLGMILIGQNIKSAMLDDTLVHRNDHYGGHVVEAIGPDYVILSGGYGVLKISVPEKSFGDPKIDILEETNPNLLIKPVVSKKNNKKNNKSK